MDVSSRPPAPSLAAPWHPKGCDRVALVLQGGGALGAYQGGVYQALHEAGLEPDWLAGVSIGSINAAIIAGNPRERRLPRLREFWETITARPIWPATPDGDLPRKLHNAWSSAMTMTQGQPGFFEVNKPGPWLSPRGSKQATSFYDNAPLRETLLRLVDFDLINSDATRFAVGAVNVTSGNFYYFDNANVDITPEHVMASAALPPALPMVQRGGDYFWDGGLVSNTPLQHLLDRIGSDNTLVFQVDLFSARGAVPRDMYDVMARQKDIQYSSRTRLITDMYKERHALRIRIRDLLARIPEADLSDEERKQKAALQHLPGIAILQLIYQQAAYEGQAKDYEFSGQSMREHWDTGYQDTKRTLNHKNWLVMPDAGKGIVMHDIHRLVS
jgi:NTE family protein